MPTSASDAVRDARRVRDVCKVRDGRPHPQFRQDVVATVIFGQPGDHALGILQIAEDDCVGITMAPDAETCLGGSTVSGFDHHDTTNFNHLNCWCSRHYLYSFASVGEAGHAGYDVNTTLGSWTTTRACDDAAGGGLVFYAAMR